VWLLLPALAWLLLPVPPPPLPFPPLPSPSPPPMLCSFLVVGLSWRWATAEALVWSCALPWPWELSAARAGDVRASMRRSPAIRTNALTTRCRASAGRLATNSPNASKCPPPRGN